MNDHQSNRGTLYHFPKFFMKFKRIFDLLRTALVVLFTEGIQAFFARTKAKLHQKPFEKKIYKEWIKKYDQWTPHDLERFQALNGPLSYKPVFSIIMPVYNIDQVWLRKAIESVRSQIYPCWELCIADDHSSLPHVRHVLEEYMRIDPRIKVTFRTENGHISAASNSALELATGEFCALMDHDDEIPKHALFRVAQELNDYPNTDLIYTDEDKINSDGARYDPHFKSDWDPDLFYTQNFICHFGVYRTSILKEIKGFRLGFEGSQDYDLALRFIEKTTADKIQHIPEILYHWRAIPGSVALGASEKKYAHAAARRAIQSHFDRTQVNARSIKGFGPLHRVSYLLPRVLPKVSIIICTKDKVELLKKAVEGILYDTDYFNVELIIVDNGSTEAKSISYFDELKFRSEIKIIKNDGPFNFSKLNNLGAKEATGSMLLLLNNDIAVLESNWLLELVSHGLRPEVGVVGPRLLYANHTIQHAGITLGIGIGGVANHPFQGLPANKSYYFGRPEVVQNCSAVTGACMLTRKEVFEEMGGFDEVNLPVAFNDVDFCLRARMEGYRVIFSPHAQLFHFESLSRGSDLTSKNLERYLSEEKYMKKRWGAVLTQDPFYNPNLAINSEGYQLAFPPRTKFQRQMQEEK